jgi:uncharacterized Tic20 family protein
MPNEEIVQEVIEGEMAVEDVPEQAPENEWTVAALAHATVLLTLVLGVAGGIGALIGPAVALTIYLGYREKSRFAAFHALQSFAYQVAGVLLYLVFTAVMVVWIVIAWVMTGLLSAVVVGFLMMPFALLMTLLVVLLLICIPIIWLGYGLYASYQVYQGRDFRYRWIGEWVEREVKF